MKRKLLSAATVLLALAVAPTAQAQHGGHGGGGHGGGGHYGGGHYGGGHYGGGHYGGYGGHYGGYGGHYGGHVYGHGDFYGHGYYSPYYSYGWDYGYPSYGYSYSYPRYTYASPDASSRIYYADDPAYVTSPVYATADRSPSRGESHSHSSSHTVTSAKRARMEVRLPDPEAEVLFEGQKTSAVGRVRLFESPDLESGKTHSYKITCRWDQDGQAMTDARRVEVTSGATTVVDFTRPAAVERVPAPNAEAPPKE